jgi:hypothetical protein
MSGRREEKGDINAFYQIRDKLNPNPGITLSIFF